jgi:hypothetical protein
MDPDEEYISFLSKTERSKFLKQRKQDLGNNKWYEADKRLQKETLPGIEYHPEYMKKSLKTDDCVTIETFPGADYLPDNMKKGLKSDHLFFKNISRIVRNDNFINTLNLNDSDKKDIINQINNLKDQGDRLFT